MMVNTTPFVSKLLPTLFVFLLAGCANTGSSPENLGQSGDVPLTTDTPEEFNSVTAARENAVQQTDELVSLEESLDTGTDDISVQVADDEIAINIPDNTIGNNVDTNNVATDIPDVTDIADPAPSLDSTDLWRRIRAGFELPDMDHPRVARDREWYASHQAYLDRTFDRAQPYLYQIVEQIDARNMPMELALLPVVESAFQPFAYSHGRAAGLWQFIPGTARRYGLAINWWYDGRRDVEAATTAALDYLEALHKRFDNDWLLALAAYNSGEGTVAAAIRKNTRYGKGTTFWDLQLPRETESYVPKLLAIAGIIADPQAYQVSLPRIDNTPYLAQVDTGSQLDLAIAAKLADMSLEELYRLNPAFNRWATAPDGPHSLLLPIDKREIFQERLAKLPKEQRVKWVRHRIKEGETLGQLAMKYKTTIKTIQTANNLRGNIIRAGHYLVIPSASQSLNQYALSEEQRLRSTQSVARSGTKTSYTVRPGDTLWDISIAHHVTVRNLAAWNGMSPRDMLKPGQKLVIWRDSNAANISLNSPAANPFANTTTRKISYRVRSGDSLARISQRFNVSVSKLKQWNPAATQGKYIQPGQRLVVYVDVTRVSENI